MARQRPQRSTLILIAIIVGASLLAGAAGVTISPVLAAHAGTDSTRWQVGATPSTPSDVLDAPAGTPPEPTAAGVTAALRSLVGVSGLGSHVGVSVQDVTTGQALFGVNAGAAMTPASVTKLVTATAVLASRGPSYRIPTRAVAGPDPGEVILIAGGDPTLSVDGNQSYPEAGRLDDLAAQVKVALGGVAPTKLVYDESIFSGPTVGPQWDSDDTTGGYGSNITALMTNGARVDPSKNTGGADRYPQPDLVAAQQFAALLGVPKTAVSAGTAPAGARQLGQVTSAPLLRIIEVMLADSDNVVAEMMARQTALARNQQASFAGEVVAERSVLEDLGIPVAGFGLADGSGLSRQGRLSPALLTALLTVDASDRHPELHGVFTGLAVGGYSGTLARRFRGNGVTGTVRAKTGTLTGVSAIAGLVTDADGRTLAFCAIADANTSTWAAEQALDKIVSTLAGCGCR